MHSNKQCESIVIYLAYLLYSLTNWITVALAWRRTADKMPGRTGWKAEISVVSPTHSLWQSPLIQFVLNMSLHCKLWEWDMMAPADWLWQCHKLTHVKSHKHAARFLLMMQSPNQKISDIRQKAEGTKWEIRYIDNTLFVFNQTTKNIRNPSWSLF